MGGRLSGWLIDLCPLRLVLPYLRCHGRSWRRRVVFGRSSRSRRAGRIRRRVGVVVERVTGVFLSRASVWRLLTGRLGWSLQRPERRAVERDESEIARWITHEWPRIKRGR
ncbi:winged helix-turn-helix domain-containing protein [Streptomyces sioyaensis]|uniref:winged helix-turn-helix domain-containing protein n=1 Tax=Streptomyces sioyaensis TaxID=67364 RepID=UPI0036E914A9